MSGIIEEKLNVNNGATLKRSDFVDRITRPVSRLVEDSKLRLRNSKRNLHSATNGSGTRNDVGVVSEKLSDSEFGTSVNRSDENSQEFEEVEVDNLYPGAITFDGENAYIVKEDVAGNKYFELYDEAELETLLFLLLEIQIFKNMLAERDKIKL